MSHPVHPDHDVHPVPDNHDNHDIHDIHDEIEARLVALVEGRLSRDAADRWAAQWLTDDTLALDEPSRWALELLYGVDLPGPDGCPLHDDAQIRGWLEEFRRRRGVAR